MTDSSHTYGQQDASYQAAGGESGLRQLVDNFYDRMGSDDRFATIYRMHPADQSLTRDKLVSFLCGWLGGPKRFNERYGSIGIPSAHAHLPITQNERDQWLQCMYEAIAEQPYAPSFKSYLIEQLKTPTEAVRKRCDPSALSEPWIASAPEAHDSTYHGPTVWVDADACPVVIRQILFKAAVRTGVALTLVANQPLPSHPAPHIKTLQVPKGFDVADDEIVRRVREGDLVVTSDIPLAAEVIEKGAEVVTPRGEALTVESIGARLNMRDFLDTMRSSGVDMGSGPSAFGQREKQAFANQLDRYLTQASRRLP